MSSNATLIATSVQADPGKMVPTELAKQAQTLAAAGDIKTAREAFKPLSESLIKYLKANPAQKGHVIQAYCPMADARWLQSGAVIRNPYLGQSMLRCGKIES